MKFRDYFQVRDWLESFIPYTYSKSNLGFERIEHLLKLLDNPQDKFKSIHIAGTSGKGSTSYYIAKLLQLSENSENSVSQIIRKLGKLSKSKNPRGGISDQSENLKHQKSESSEYSEPKIGLHLSPHLVDIRERMQINGELIPMNKFIKLMNEMKNTVGKMNDSEAGLPSYFEILVAASFKYFADGRVDWAVVEVGLGGRLDATNVLKPEITVITNVGLDHTDILGTTIEKIAFEKAGIVKRWVPVVIGVEGDAFEVIKKVAKEKNAPLITVNTQLGVKPLKSEVQSYLKDYYEILNSRLEFFAFQNLKVALATVLSLQVKPAKEVVNKVSKLTFPGRFEQIEPNIILDGAHNVDKMRFLIRCIKSTIDYRLSTIVLVIAFKKGKDWKKMVDLLIKNLPVKKVITTEFNQATDTGFFASVDAREIADYISSIVNRRSTIVEAMSNSHEAVYQGLVAKSERANGLLLVTGSLYLVGEARTIWHLPTF